MNLVNVPLVKWSITAPFHGAVARFDYGRECHLISMSYVNNSFGGFLERSNRRHCKCLGLSLRLFESTTLQTIRTLILYKYQNKQTGLGGEVERASFGYSNYRRFKSCSPDHLLSITYEDNRTTNNYCSCDYCKYIAPYLGISCRCLYNIH